MVLQNAINNLITSQAANRVYGIDRRQCISASNNNFITSVTGLNATIAGSASQPITCTFAVGWDVLGIPIDYVGTFTSSQSFTALTANTTHFFYLERNTITGALTCNKTTIVPIYSQTVPTSPVTGQHWFKTFTDSLTSQQGYKMYEWSGSVWVVRQRVFIAEISTNASAVNGAGNYANNRQYISDWLTVGVAATINFSHNLGMTVAQAAATLTFYGRQNSSDSLESFVPSGFYFNTIAYGVFNYGTGNRLNHAFFVGDAGIYYPAGAWLTVADIRCSINSTW